MYDDELSQVDRFNKNILPIFKELFILSNHSVDLNSVVLYFKLSEDIKSVKAVFKKDATYILRHKSTGVRRKKYVDKDLGRMYKHSIVTEYTEIEHIANDKFYTSNWKNLYLN